jgi:hypothetical protein
MLRYAAPLAVNLLNDQSHSRHVTRIDNYYYFAIGKIRKACSDACFIELYHQAMRELASRHRHLVRRLMRVDQCALQLSHNLSVVVRIAKIAGRRHFKLDALALQLIG